MTHEETTPRRITRRSAADQKSEKSNTTQGGSSQSSSDKVEKSKTNDKKQLSGSPIKTRRSIETPSDPPVKRELRNSRKFSACSNGSDISKSDSLLSDMPRVMIEKNKVEKIERDRLQREKGDKLEKGDKSDKGDKLDKGDKSEKGDKLDKGDKVEKGDKLDKSDKNERPPPLLIPCNISTRQQNGTEKGATDKAGGSTDSNGESGREEILENILSWRMLPPEIEAKLPTPPSLLYGPQHLLRMFGKSQFG